MKLTHSNALLICSIFHSSFVLFYVFSFSLCLFLFLSLPPLFSILLLHLPLTPYLRFCLLCCASGFLSLTFKQYP